MGRWNPWIYFLILLLWISCTPERNYSANDTPLPAPQTDEWRMEQPEPAQSLSDFKKSKPLQPDAQHQQICLLPLGSFSTKQEKQLRACAEYIQIFFQLPCSLQPLQEPTFPPYAQRIGRENQQQYLAPYILDTLLPTVILPDALASMALSANDIYPSADWNYVFGLASYTKRVAVSSMYRFHPNYYPDSVYDHSFSRLIKTASHEIGHMFGLHHCQHARCVMNGSNSLSELDKAPCRLCSSCSEKLHYSLGFDVKKRTKELCIFFEKRTMQSAMRDIENDLILLND